MMFQPLVVDSLAASRADPVVAFADPAQRSVDALVLVGIPANQSVEQPTTLQIGGSLDRLLVLVDDPLLTANMLHGASNLTLAFFELVALTFDLDCDHLASRRPGLPSPDDRIGYAHC